MSHMNIQVRPLFPRNIQVGIRLVYVIACPKQHFQRNNRSNDLKPEHTSRNLAYNNRQADTDNLVKFTLDAISNDENQTILTDDMQIIHIDAVKMFEEWNEDEGPYTFVDVYEWNEEKTLALAPPTIVE